MDWNVEEVVTWLADVGLSKYAKRFKGFLVNGAVLVQMDETLLDDLEVKDPGDREILLRETARLAATKSDKSQLSEIQDMAQRGHVLDTPLITVSNFDEGDVRPRLVLLCDDEDFPYNKRKKSSDEFINQRIINLAYSDGEESTTDGGSERDFSFKDSDEEHDFNIYDEDKDVTDDSTPVASAVASRATQMVELLSRDNVALREKLENVYFKMNSMQTLECELQSMRSAYEELQISFRKQEDLEYSTRTRMESEIGKLQENNRNLKAELDRCGDEVEQGKKSLENFRSDLKLKNEVIRQLIVQSNNFAATRDDLENTIKQQRNQIEELEREKDRLNSSLVQSQERILYLQQELKKQQLHTNHVIPDSKTHGLHVTERSAVKDDTCLTNDEKTTHHRHTNSADEGIAELDGPTSVPVLLELLREKDDRIQVLGENISRLEQTLLQEGTSRNLAIRAVSVPKEARIAALEKSIEEREKIITECRGQNLKSVEELYVANRRCADLEAIIKSLHLQLAEKTARLCILQNSDEEEPNEPEWPLDPAFCRTDFAQMKDLALDSYAESLDSGMSLTNATDVRHTDPELKAIDEPDQLSVHYWSV
ncbi:angiomotin-like [Orbicella faveolata]|uniref:angiomotin-like n=1 Tax=Orbicella faveolata TaxID=48498 RepID=UPI0009E2CEEC|nr:angiomotin-like [Orbicella faveolata]